MTIDSTFTLHIGDNIVDEAMSAAADRNLSQIYCGLTGAPVGLINEAELRNSMRAELSRDPFATVDDLLEVAATQQFIYSSRPAPSLSYHRDRDTFLYVLRGGKDGSSRLLTYLTGRLFFETFVREKDIDSSLLRQARLAFLVECYGRAEELPDGWSRSLTADDELEKTSDSSVAILDRIGNIPPTDSEEAKAAQRALESLLRLDTIYNLRNKFYNAKLRRKVDEFRDSTDWSFRDLSALLSDIEDDGIVRLSKREISTDQNLTVLTAALDSLGWASKRINLMRDRLAEVEAKRLIGPSTPAGQILNSIRATLTDADALQKLSKKDKKDLESAAKALETDLRSVKTTDRRVDALHRLYAKRGATNETVTVIKGAQRLKHLAESYIDSGQPVPPALKQKLEQARKAGELKSRPTKKKQKTSPQQAAALDDAILGSGLADMFKDGES